MESADGSFDNQISLIENFIEQGVDCILVDPLDSEGLRPTIEKASAARYTHNYNGWESRCGY